MPATDHGDITYRDIRDSDFKRNDFAQDLFTREGTGI